jgi:hypothetical protein
VALDPEDVQVLDEKIRRAVAAGVSTALYAGAEVVGEQGSPGSARRMLRRLAMQFEAGDVPEGAAMELQLVPVIYEEVDLDVEVPAPAETRGVQAIDAGTFGARGVLKPWGAEEFGPEMVKWLDLFDDRIRAAQEFVNAVNEAAEAGRPADETTARMVAERIGEMREQARRFAQGEA